jgi:hypothetical protein
VVAVALQPYSYYNFRSGSMEHSREPEPPMKWAHHPNLRKRPRAPSKGRGPAPLAMKARLIRTWIGPRPFDGVAGRLRRLG